MQIAIIGAGWTGCHLGLTLHSLGHKVAIYEQAADIFTAASGKNQCRLHQGFHYPRSPKTILELSSAFKQFKKNYPDFCLPVKNNYYAIAAQGSKIDFNQYLNQLQEGFLDYRVLDLKNLNFKNLSGLIQCQEELIDNQQAAKFFRSKLKDLLILNTKVEIEELQKLKDFDLIINCTNCWPESASSEKFIYEVCALARYKALQENEFALTVMDGNFCSLYPCLDFGKAEFLLSAVDVGVLAETNNFIEAQEIMDQISQADLLEVRNKMERLIGNYYPKFNSHFKHIDFITSIKIKPNPDLDAQRLPLVFYEKKIVSVLNFKISGIFKVTEQVLPYLI